MILSPATRSRVVRATGLLCAIVIAVLTTSFASPTPVSAWCNSAYKWPAGPGHEAWANGNIPTGFRGAVRNGVINWNGVTNSTWSVSYFPPNPGGGSPTSGGWINWGGGPGFGGAPAVTQVSQINGVITSANTYFNTAFTWNADGIMDQAQMKADVTTVGLHELGHWLMLLHPSQCGAMTAAEVAAVMNPNWTKKWVLGTDDRAASAAKY